LANRYLGTTSTASKSLNSLYVGAAAGGTLAGGQVVQIVFDDSIFTSAPEGKQRLLAAIDSIKQRVETARTWPIDANS
jgi:hypothetical protein